MTSTIAGFILSALKRPPFKYTTQQLFEAVAKSSGMPNNWELQVSTNTQLHKLQREGRISDDSDDTWVSSFQTTLYALSTPDQIDVFRHRTESRVDVLKGRIDATKQSLRDLHTELEELNGILTRL
jgi:hypothetical protein